MECFDLEHQNLNNRTGILTHRELSKKAIEGANQAEPSSDGDAETMAAIRAQSIAEALPIGSNPPLMHDGDGISDGGASAADSEFDDLDDDEEKPLLGTGFSAQQGAVAMLLDKMGERAAFERQGVRLYEACLQKCETVGESPVGPTLDELREIRDQELEHFRMLQECITAFNGDATSQTPSADIAGVISQSLVQVVGDPRTTMAQAMQAMLVAELADNNGWELLIDLSLAAGNGDMIERFQTALEDEVEHLNRARRWLAALVLEEAGLDTEATLAASEFSDDTDYDAAEDERAEPTDEGQNELPPNRSDRNARQASRPAGTNDRADHAFEKK